MTDIILEKLNTLGYSLPAVPAPVAAYVNCVRSGNLLFLSGGLPIDDERKIIGKVPTKVSIEKAREGARMIVLNRLAVIRAEIGSLDKVRQIVALNGFVNSATDFYGHPQVINGASELLVEIFGDKGKHSRTALGAAALPLNVAVEINLIVEIEDAPKAP
ncbi:MAG: RidA family protein [Luteolibacter sp.]|jgi:enamine deaminase RidA (YjgF/YER057c/UK114 family)|nr:RidA family protein [Luteolibacter sp.]